MENIYKVFVIDRTPYVGVDEKVIIGDKAIVSVNDMVPTIIDCQNDEQIRLIQEPKTSMTKRYKLLENFDIEKISDDIIDLAIETQRAVIISELNGIITIIQ